MSKTRLEYLYSICSFSLCSLVCEYEPNSFCYCSLFEGILWRQSWALVDRPIWRCEGHVTFSKPVSMVMLNLSPDGRLISEVTWPFGSSLFWQEHKHKGHLTCFCAVTSADRLWTEYSLDLSSLLCCLSLLQIFPGLCVLHRLDELQEKHTVPEPENFLCLSF